jgi:hypothetical protein
VETNKLRERYSYLSDHPKSKLLFVSLKPNPRIRYTLKVKGKAMNGELNLGEFMDVKGWKAVGNRLSDSLLQAVKEVEGVQPEPAAAPTAPQTDLFGQPEPPARPAKKEAAVSGVKLPAEAKKPAVAKPAVKSPPKENGKKTFKPGDTIEFD